MFRNLLSAFPSKKKCMLTITAALAALLMVLAICPLGLKMAASYREERALLKVMSLCGAELQSVNVTGWARVAGQEEIDLEELVSRSARLLKLAGSGGTPEKWENSYARGVKVQGTMPGGATCTVLGQTMELLQGQRVTHLMISLGTEAGRAGYYKEKVRKVLAAQSADEHVALTYTGKINWALNQEELSESAEELMAGAGAAVGEKTVKDNLVSLTGHSLSLPDSLNYEGKKINLNVALRSSAEEQATYVYVASPVIYTEY